MTPLEIAAKYQGRGFQPLPIAHRSKNPNFPGWQTFETTEADLPKYFNGAAQNVGVLLGSKSNGLTDLDLDSTEAIKTADYFHVPTEAEFGRASKTRSHRLYYCDEDLYEKYNNPFLLDFLFFDERQKLKVSDMEFLKLNSGAILCQLQQSLLMKHLFNHSPEQFEDFAHEIAEREAIILANCPKTQLRITDKTRFQFYFDAVNQTTRKWFTDLLEKKT
jgi:hypothetical protein